MLLQEKHPFSHVPFEEASNKVMNGIRPPLSTDILNSTDPIVNAFKEAMVLCHTHDPTERITARGMERFLKDKLELYDPGRLKEWGES